MVFQCMTVLFARSHRRVEDCLLPTSVPCRSYCVENHIFDPYMYISQQSFIQVCRIGEQQKLRQAFNLSKPSLTVLILGRGIEGFPPFLAHLSR